MPPAAGAIPHVLIPTHLPRYLDLVLAALARQTVTPETITVTCDDDRDDIGEVIRRCAHDFGLSVTWLRRAHMNGERLCQIRNNAVRDLAERLGVDWRRDSRDDPRTLDADAAQHRIITLDGDMIAPDTLVEQHCAIHDAAPDRPPLIYAYRLDVPRDVSGSLDARDLFERGAAALGLRVTPEADAKLRKRDRRYTKHLLLRRLGLAPLHKPKLLGGHFSCTLDQYLRLNGFDELYQGWGFKDDEFAYRAARLREPVAVAVRRIPAFHLWHDTRQADAPMRTLPTARRFEQRRTLPLVCDHGVRSPLPQADLERDTVEPVAEAP